MSQLHVGASERLATFRTAAAGTPGVRGATHGPNVRSPATSAAGLLTFVPLRQNLYNLNPPCKKLISVVETDVFTDLTQQPYNHLATKPSQKRARRLSQAEIAALVEDYRSGVGSHRLRIEPCERRVA